MAEVTLQQVLEALQRDIDSDGVAEIRQAELSIIAERLAEMERDAARYRWIKRRHHSISGDHAVVNQALDIVNPDLDAYIDAATSAEPLPERQGGEG